ncbi:hypothetical protein BJ912DRAFT_1055886 [Pholiota molesta]|nr:hypothetical protein BJ912DRAFT_1055886 [Pholiota molesta]
MSRLSRANLNSRESIFAGGPEQYLGDIQARCPPDLEECVMAMEDCCEEACEAQVLLRNGTKDFVGTQHSGPLTRAPFYLLASITPPRTALPARAHIPLCNFPCTSAVTLHRVRLSYLPALVTLGEIEPLHSIVSV